MEPESHKIAVKFVCDFIGKWWDSIFDFLPAVHAPLKWRYPCGYVEQNKLKKFPGHEYDIGCTRPLMCPVLIVEIGNVGDDTKHNASHKEQLINDGIAEKYIREYYPECRFFRFNKDDCLYPSFLKDNLFFKDKR